MRVPDRSWRILLFVGLMGAASAAPGRAQDTPTEEAPVATYTLTITEPAELVQEVGTTRRLHQTELQALHARTLDEALRLLPGVYVRTANDTPRIDVRGFRSRHVLLLIDGVPMNSTDDNQFDPRQIPTESIREVNVTYGASSILYGDNAMAGVIEVVTETPRAGVHGGGSADLGKATQGDGTGRISIAGGRASIVATGSAFSTGGFSLPDGFTATSTENGGIRGNSDVDRRSGLVKVAVAATSALRLGALVSVNRGSYGIPPSTVADKSDIFAQTVQYQRVDRYRNLLGQGSFDWGVAKAFNLRGWGYVNGQNEDRSRYDSATYSSVDDPLVSGTYKEHNESRISGGQLLGRWDLARAGALRLTVNGRRESFDTSGVIRDVTVGGSGSGSGSGSGGGGGGGGGKGGTTTTTPTTYALRSFAESHRLDVFSTGVEWEVHPVTRTGAVVGFARNWQQRAGAADDAGTSLIAGLTYDVSKVVRLHVSGTRKVRFPSITQLYDAAAGNSSLQAERANEGEGGVTATWPRLGTFGATVFTTHVTGFIERDSGARYSNRDRYGFTGTEFTYDTRPFRFVSVHASYSYLDSQDLGGTTQGGELQYRPKHRPVVDTRWVLPSRFSARAAVSYVAGQVYYSRTTPAVQATARNYTLVDASITRALSANFDVTMSVDNAFDELYTQSYGQPRAGRTLLLSLRGRF
jgi:vitamin B12 transporter